jgi:hypothetical protein
LAALAIQDEYDIRDADSLSAEVFHDSDDFAQDVTQPGLQSLSNIIVDIRRDPLDTSSTSESSNVAFSHTLDGIPLNLLVALDSLPFTQTETLSTLAEPDSKLGCARS